LPDPAARPRYLAVFRAFFHVRRAPDRSAKRYRLASVSQAAEAAICPLPRLGFSVYCAASEGLGWRLNGTPRPMRGRTSKSGFRCLRFFGGPFEPFQGLKGGFAPGPDTKGKGSMALYEHVFIARQDVSQQQVEGLTEQFSTIIKENG